LVRAARWNKQHGGCGDFVQFEEVEDIKEYFRGTVFHFASRWLIVDRYILFFIMFCVQ